MSSLARGLFCPYGGSSAHRQNCQLFYDRLKLETWLLPLCSEVVQVDWKWFLVCGCCQKRWISAGGSRNTIQLGQNRAARWRCIGLRSKTVLHCLLRKWRKVDWLHDTWSGKGRKRGGGGEGGRGRRRCSHVKSELHSRNFNFIHVVFLRLNLLKTNTRSINVF